jgi:hypothetical protein
MYGAGVISGARRNFLRITSAVRKPQASGNFLSPIFELSINRCAALADKWLAKKGRTESLRLTSQEQEDLQMAVKQLRQDPYDGVLDLFP